MVRASLCSSVPLVLMTGSARSTRSCGMVIVHSLFRVTNKLPLDALRWLAWWWERDQLDLRAGRVNGCAVIVGN